MTDWPATLAICERKLAQGRCCLGLNAQAHGWCSVDRHADKWIECGMKPPAKRGEDESMKGEILPPVAHGDMTIPLEAPEGLSEWQVEQFWGTAFSRVYRTGVAAIVAAGRILVHAKSEIPPGRWTQWVEDRLPISYRTAAQLMQIASDHNINRWLGAHVNHDSHLPQDRAILAELCGHAPDEFDRLASEGVIHAEMKRGDLRRHLVEHRHNDPALPPTALPDGKYGAILADPSWPFQTRGEGGKGRSAENHYPTMTMSQIYALGRDVSARAAGDSVLFLWATSDRLSDAIEVMEYWGFIYASTAFVWVKEGAPGLGYWTRKQAEICLLGTRGSPKRLNADVAEVIHAPRGPHSQKPEEAYERIERLVAGPYLELFARQPRDGWDAWGNDPALRDEAAE